METQRLHSVYAVACARGPGFARVTGAAADIGAFESDVDRILTNGFD